MAVPPDGAQVIFEALFNTLMENDYDGIEPNIDVDKRIRELEKKEGTLF